MKNKRAVYYVIEFEDYNASEPLAPVGPFESVKEAEAWLVEDAANLLQGSEEFVSRSEATTWASPAHIVKVVKTVRQVPRYEVKVGLQRA